MSSSPDWIKFFSAAGIPSRYAAKYAVIFNDHRIQEDMLKDLNKEILYDMGIKTMGDVIAIMRHAKDVDEEKSRDRVLSGRNQVSEAPAAKRIVKRIVEEKSDLPATLSNSLSRRLGATAAAPVRKIEAIDIREPIVKRVVVGTSAADRVIRLPSSGSGSVFQRLGGTAGAGDSSMSSSTLMSGSALRGLSLTAASSQPLSVKATATVRPTRTSPYSVKDRLGAGKGDPVRKVVSSNLKFKTDPPSAAAVTTSRPQVVSLKRSIFDRLGS